MSVRRATYLLILAERQALAWVVSEQRMAFPARRASAASVLQPGDDLLLYTTRGCFHNPTRDRGRVVGTARVASKVELLERPVRLAGREFPVGCDIAIAGLAPLRTGVELSPLVPRLAAFPSETTWNTRMRRPLLGLPRVDAELICERLRPFLRPRREVLPGYVSAGRAAA